MDELDRLTDILARAYETTPAQMLKRIMRCANAEHRRPIVFAREIVSKMRHLKPRRDANKAFAAGKVPPGLADHDEVIRQAKALKRVALKGETLAQAYDHILADEADHDRRDMATRLGIKLPEA